MYPAIESRSFLFDFLSCFLCNLLFRIKEYQTSYWKGFNELRIRGEKLWEANEEAIKADVRYLGRYFQKSILLLTHFLLQIESIIYA